VTGDESVHKSLSARRMYIRLLGERTLINCDHYCWKSTAINAQRWVGLQMRKPQNRLVQKKQTLSIAHFARRGVFKIAHTDPIFKISAIYAVPSYIRLQ
jgi:hypothetical protein